MFSYNYCCKQYQPIIIIIAIISYIIIIIVIIQPALGLKKRRETKMSIISNDYKRNNVSQHIL